MAFEVDNKGNITLVQGDSGTYCIEGLPTDKNYTIYFAVQDENRKPVGTEISVTTNFSASVLVVLTAAFTDALTVKPDEEVAVYNFGLKLCSEDGVEDTLLIGESVIGENNTITVYPKKVEGT